MQSVIFYIFHIIIAIARLEYLSTAILWRYFRDSIVEATTIKYDFPTPSHLSILFVLDSFCATSPMSFEKNQYYSSHILLVLPKAASLWENDFEGGRFCVRLRQKRKYSDEERANGRDRGRELELAVVWKRQHTRLYGGLPDNRHCAPAITRNRTRQHHASIVRVSASILLLSRFLSLSLTLSRSSYISFISFHSL